MNRQEYEYLESQVKNRFTREARERFGTVKIAYPNRAMQLVMYLSKTPNRENPITDEQLKSMLKQIAPKRDITIKRK